MFASVRNALEATRALVDAGADLSVTTAVKDYVKIEAEATAQRERRARVRKAAEDPDPEAEAERPRANSGRQPCLTPDDPNLPTILSSTEQIGPQGGFAALHFTAREGHMEAARLLVEAGADVDQVTGGSVQPSVGRGDQRKLRPGDT